MLYPQQNDRRNRLDLSGFWDFKLDPDEVGEEQAWFDGFADRRTIAVPGSWNEQYQDTRDYLDVAWYARETFVPDVWKGQRIFLRVGSANYFAKVWINDVLLGEHAGGHLPFVFEVTDHIAWGAPNRITIRVENKLMPTRVPPGNVGSAITSLLASYPNAAFDFFPYAGLHRPVLLAAVPKLHIEDVTVVTGIGGTDGTPSARGGTVAGHVEVTVTLSEGVDGNGRVILNGEGAECEAELVFQAGLAHATLAVPNARLWGPEDPYLYQLSVLFYENGRIADRYTLDVGIRTIEVQGDQLLLNGEPISLRGFGKHEDFPVHGRGLNMPLLVKENSLFDWLGANSYRTSHYPYSEEAMRLADREGVLIIDETPAVGLTFNDGDGNIKARLEQCKQQLRELVARDKNHPSVIMWSLANEPMPGDVFEQMSGGEAAEEREAAGVAFFSDLIGLARTLDATRPVTVVAVMFSPWSWMELCDVVCINRYWGWYTQGGQLDAASQVLGQELDELHAAFGKPILISEFGADTISGLHSDPPEMWTEEYQVEMLRQYLDAAARRPYVAGLHVWNFADFKTGQSIGRAGGLNRKGVFTRDRRPKMAAHFLRGRWAGVGPLVAPYDSTQPEESSAVAQPATPSAWEALSRLADRLDGLHPGTTATVKFRLIGEGVYRLVIQDGACRAEQGEGPADATVTIQAEDGLKLLTGALSPMLAAMSGKLEIEGDLGTLAILQGVV